MRKGQISDDTYAVCLDAFAKFGDVFRDEPAPALVHGDYNVWNILVNEARTTCVGVIDPFNCGWADRDYDLYQLGNIDQNGFALPERYAAARPPSDNTRVKLKYYELFTEIAHYFDANVNTGHPNCRIAEIAAELRHIIS